MDKNRLYKRLLLQQLKLLLQYILKRLHKIHSSQQQHRRTPLPLVLTTQRNKNNSGSMLVTKRYQQGRGRGNRIVESPGKWPYNKSLTRKTIGLIFTTTPGDTQFLQNVIWFWKRRMQSPDGTYWRR